MSRREYERPPFIILIGPRGAGKSTVSRELAQRLGGRAVDLDELALAAFDEATVHDVWAAHGEKAWRDAECAAIKSLLETNGEPASTDQETEQTPSVIALALGGGVPMIPGARKAIEQAAQDGRAYVVYLRTSLDELRRRLAQEPGDRPSLTGADPVEEVAKVLAEREPTYEALAQAEILTDGLTTEAIAAAIIDQL
jgi:shikimate kinase